MYEAFKAGENTYVVLRIGFGDRWAVNYLQLFSHQVEEMGVEGPCAALVPFVHSRWASLLYRYQLSAISYQCSAIKIKFRKHLVVISQHLIIIICPLMTTF
jgi:hypothetical protein